MFILPLKASISSYFNKGLISPLKQENKLNDQIAKSWQQQNDSLLHQGNHLKDGGSSIWPQRPFDALRKQVHKINAWASSTWQVVSHQIPNERRQLVRNVVLSTMTLTGLAILAKYLKDSSLVQAIEDTSHSSTQAFKDIPISSNQEFKVISNSSSQVFKAIPFSPTEAFKAIPFSPTEAFKAIPISSTSTNNVTSHFSEDRPLDWDYTKNFSILLIALSAGVVLYCIKKSRHRIQPIEPQFLKQNTSNDVSSKRSEHRSKSAKEETPNKRTADSSESSEQLSTTAKEETPNKRTADSSESSEQLSTTAEDEPPKIGTVDQCGSTEQLADEEHPNIDTFRNRVKELLEKENDEIYRALMRRNNDGSIVLHNKEFLRASLPLLRKMVDPGHEMVIAGHDQEDDGRKMVEAGRKEEGARLVEEGASLKAKGIVIIRKVFPLLFSQTNLSLKTPLHDVEFDDGLVELIDILYNDIKNLVRLFSIQDANKETCILSNHNFEKYVKIVCLRGKKRFFDGASLDVFLQMYRNRLAGRDPAEIVYFEGMIQAKKVPSEEKKPADEVSSEEMKPADEVSSEEMKPADKVSSEEKKPADEVSSEEMKPADEVSSEEMKPADKVSSEEKKTADKVFVRTLFPRQKLFKDCVRKWMDVYDLNRCVSAILQRENGSNTFLHDPNKFNDIVEYIIKIGKVDINQFFDIVSVANDHGQTPLHLTRFSAKLINFFNDIADTQARNVLKLFEKQDSTNRTCLVKRVGVSNFELVAGILTKISELSLSEEREELSQGLIEVLRATYSNLQADILLHSLPILQNLMKFKSSKVKSEAAKLFGNALSAILENEMNVRAALEMTKDKISFDQLVSSILFDKIVNSYLFIELVNSILSDKDVEDGLKTNLINQQKTIEQLSRAGILKDVEEMLKTVLFNEIIRLVLNDKQVKSELERLNLNGQDVEEKLKASFTQIFLKEEKILTHLNQECTRIKVERKLKASLMKSLKQSETLTPLNQKDEPSPSAPQNLQIEQGVSPPPHSNRLLQ